MKRKKLEDDLLNLPFNTESKLYNYYIIADRISNNEEFNSIIEKYKSEHNLKFSVADNLVLFS